MKRSVMTAVLLSVSLSACAKPAVDCAVFPAQHDSPYVLPYEVGTAWDIYATTEPNSTAGGLHSR